MNLSHRKLILFFLTTCLFLPLAQAGKVLTALDGDLVVMEGKTLKSFSGLSSANTHVAFYFSAEWCPPCRKFTPGLVSWYEGIKQKYPGFELVFVSSDQSPKDMEKYMENYKMLWPAIKHTKIERHTDLVKATGNGIPNMTFMDAEGNVLSSAYADGNYRGPGAVLKDIEKVLASSGSSPTAATAPTASGGSAPAKTLGDGSFDIFKDKR